MRETHIVASEQDQVINWNNGTQHKELFPRRCQHNAITNTTPRKCNRQSRNGSANSQKNACKWTYGNGRTVYNDVPLYMLSPNGYQGAANDVITDKHVIMEKLDSVRIKLPGASSRIGCDVAQYHRELATSIKAFADKRWLRYEDNRYSTTPRRRGCIKTTTNISSTHATDGLTVKGIARRISLDINCDHGPKTTVMTIHKTNSLRPCIRPQSSPASMSLEQTMKDDVHPGDDSITSVDDQHLSDGLDNATVNETTTCSTVTDNKAIATWEKEQDGAAQEMPVPEIVEVERDNTSSALFEADVSDSNDDAYKCDVDDAGSTHDDDESIECDDVITHEEESELDDTTSSEKDDDDTSNDEDNGNIEDYNFADPLSFGEIVLDVVKLATDGAPNWRANLERDAIVHIPGEWLDRLVQIERLQRLQTDNAENRTAKPRSARGRRSASLRPCSADCARVTNKIQLCNDKCCRTSYEMYSRYTTTSQEPSNGRSAKAIHTTHTTTLSNQPVADIRITGHQCSTKNAVTAHGAKTARLHNTSQTSRRAHAAGIRTNSSRVSSAVSSRTLARSSKHKELSRPKTAQY